MARARAASKSNSAFRTISEVSDHLQVPQHVLRFWETKFEEVQPMKRGGGRRYYRPEDIELLRQIRDCLYADGYTIKGVQKLLREGQLDCLPAGTSGAKSKATAKRETKDMGETPSGSHVDTPSLSDTSSQTHDAPTPNPQSSQTMKNQTLSEADRTMLYEVLYQLQQARADLEAATPPVRQSAA